MYVFVDLEKIIYFFEKFSIDITLFSNFELSIIILLSNILVLLFYIFMFNVIWKLTFRLLDWWF